MKWLTETAKVDVGMVGQTISDSNVTGPYFDMQDYRRAVGILIDGASADTKVSTIAFMQATDADGSGPAKAVSGATASITCPTLVTKATVALATVLNGQTITINGLVFTAHTDTTVKASRQFAIDGDDTADAAALASCINDATYGVPGITAAADTGTITLTSTDPGEKAITLAQSAATFTFAQVEAIAFVELDASQLDLANGFRFVALKVTRTGNGIAAALLARYRARYTPTQVVGASAYK
jgi:hypothetical protein